MSPPGPIPNEALEHHVAFLGKTGSGKSNAAKVIVEDALDTGERVCVLDPTGAWWGLRLNRGGKASKYPVVIFGGLHGDVPIGREHGEAVAEVVATSSTPAVIDTRLMTVGERTAFFTAFAQALLRKNRGALRLVIDEAHVFAPQGRVADPRSGEMLHAANNLVSLGRSIGLRIMLISQRPAKLHKDSLTQVETLVAMRLIAPQDRSAVQDWIGEWADKEQGKEIIQSLPSLKTGDAWVWSPEIGFLERVHFPLARTYDSGKAPTEGADAPELKPLDLKTVNALLETAAAELKANDPRQLKARLAELERQLAAAPKASGPSWPDVRAELAAAENRIVDLEAAIDTMNDQMNQVWSRFCVPIAEMQDAQNVCFAVRNRLIAPQPQRERGHKDTDPKARVRPPDVARAGEVRAPRPGEASPATSDGLSGPQRNVLKSLAWWKAMGKDAPTRNQVAVICGWSTNSSNIRDRCSELARMGMIDRPSPGHLRLTDEGLANAPAPDLGRTLLDSLRLILTGPQQSVLDALLALGGERTRDELADHIGWSRDSSNIRDRLSELGRLDIIERPKPGIIALQDWIQ